MIWSSWQFIIWFWTRGNLVWFRWSKWMQSVRSYSFELERYLKIIFMSACFFIHLYEFFLNSTSGIWIEFSSQKLETSHCNRYINWHICTCVFGKDSSSFILVKMCKFSKISATSWNVSDFGAQFVSGVPTGKIYLGCPRGLRLSASWGLNWGPP